MNKEKIIPEIRISGFMDSINKYKLADVVDRVRSYPLSRNVETNDDTGYRYVHYGDIHTKVANIIDLNSNLPNIECGNYDLLKKGDIILADASEDYQGIATPSIVNVETPYKLVAGLHTIAFRPKKVDSLYLYYLFNSKNFRKYGYRVGTGMKVFGISVSNVMKYEGLFPSVAEQSKIGLLFKKIDETITLQHQLLSDYKQLKKAMLQQMIPQKGETVPKVRFAGFSGDWKKTKLKSAIENEFKGKTQLSKLSKGLVEYLDTERLNGGKSYLSNGEQNVSEEDILILWDGSKAGTIYKGFKGSLGSTLKAYTINSKNNSEFIYQFLKHKEKVIYINYRTPNIPHVVKDFSDVFPIFIPCYEEQEKIGQLFKKLDETIEGHEQKLATYHELKKALLQRMFV